MLRFCKASSQEHAKELLEHPRHWAICLTPDETWAMAWSEDLADVLNDKKLRNKLFSAMIRSEEGIMQIPVGAVLDAGPETMELILRRKREFKGFNPTKAKKKK